MSDWQNYRLNMSTIINKITREYIDLDFAFEQHPSTNNVTIKKNNNAIKQSILNLLTLRSGDKPFHPEIKSPIYDFLFENASMVTKIVLEGELKKYLNVYEPRISITTATVDFPDNNTISCTVVGTIINLSTPFTVNILIDRLR